MWWTGGKREKMRDTVNYKKKKSAYVILNPSKYLTILQYLPSAFYF